MLYDTYITYTVQRKFNKLPVVPFTGSKTGSLNTYIHNIHNIRIVYLTQQRGITAMTSDKAYLRLEIGKETQRRFKAACVLEGKTMNRKAQELIEEWLREQERKGK